MLYCTVSLNCDLYYCCWRSKVLARFATSDDDFSSVDNSNKQAGPMASSIFKILLSRGHRGTRSQKTKKLTVEWFYCSIKLKSNVSNYSTNKTVHGLESNYFIHKLSLRPVVFSRSYRPEGQDHTENVTVEWFYCSIKLKSNVSNYSRNKTVHGLESNYLIHKLFLWPVVFSRSYRPEGQGKGSLNSGIRRIKSSIKKFVLKERGI